MFFLNHRCRKAAQEKRCVVERTDHGRTLHHTQKNNEPCLRRAESREQCLSFWGVGGQTTRGPYAQFCDL